jgi:hypothetical protein
MDKLTRKSLSEADLELLRACKAKKLRSLSEDELIALHTRVRRARNKYAKLHRRQAGAQVVSDRSRGAASKVHRASSGKAEVFEKALARTSKALARAARESAEALKQERLSAAKAGKGSKGMVGKASAADTRRRRRRSKRPPVASKRANAKQKTPIRKRSRAAERAATRRYEATRVNR